MVCFRVGVKNYKKQNENKCYLIVLKFKFVNLFNFNLFCVLFFNIIFRFFLYFLQIDFKVIVLVEKRI